MIVDLWRELSRIDRPAVSAGHEAALGLLADYVHDAGGASLEVTRYAADGSRDAWGIRRPQPWTLRAARLVAGDGRLLADAASAPLHVASGSPCGYGTDVRLHAVNDPRDGLSEYPVAAVLPRVEDGAFRWAGWERISERCKLLITTVSQGLDRDNEAGRWQIARLELPAEFPCPVFVVSTAVHRELRDLAVGGHSVSFACDVDVAPRDLLAAHVTLQGKAESGARLLVVAHSCHRAPSAIDNSSGLAVWAQCIVETVAALQRPGRFGEVQDLTYLACPEITGTAAFLQDAGASRFDAGVVLDMMTVRQRSRSALGIDLPPSYLHGADPMVRAIRRHVSRWKEPVRFTAFEARSDHLLLNDPQVGIVSCRLGYEPDPRNHTSADVCSSADEAVLKSWPRRIPALLETISNIPPRRDVSGGPGFEPRSFLESLSPHDRLASRTVAMGLGHSLLVRLAHLYKLGLSGAELAEGAGCDVESAAAVEEAFERVRVTSAEGAL